MLFKKTVVSALAAAMIFAAPLAPFGISGEANADVVDSEVLYRRKSWQVSIVEFDDGSYACLAQVSDGNRSFTIWADASENANLQFYDSSWDFNDSSEDIIVQIDRRADWTLNNASLNQNSVFFTLPDSDTSLRFIREVMRGNTLKLYNDDRVQVERYSLAGSSASILKLTECVDLLQQADGDDNPFN